MLDSWKYCVENKGLEIYGWCINKDTPAGKQAGMDTLDDGKSGYKEQQQYRLSVMEAG